MKRLVISALAVTLLSGTSALAQEGQRGGPLSRVVREAAANAQAERTPPPQRESRPQAAPQSRGDQFNGSGRGRPDNAGQAPASRPQSQQGRGQQSGAQRPQGGAQGQRGPDGRTGQAQGRPPFQATPGGQRGSDTRPTQTQTRPAQQYDRGTQGRPLTDEDRNAIRRGGYENAGPGWNNNNNTRPPQSRPPQSRPPQGRPPVVRPEDRRDRDRNRPQYDQRRYPHYVTPRQRYQWRGPTYRAPVGFYSFRWQWGQTLPWNWYTPNYYLDDYWAYGLPRPPIGCEWIRAGDDAILVDVFTGRVYQVVYNLFW